MAKKNKEKNILIEWLRKKYNINGLGKKGMIVFIIGAILYFIGTTFIQEYAKGLFKQKTQLPITVSVNSSTGADERDIDSYMIYMNEEYDYNFIDMYNFIDDLYKEKKINYNTKALLIKGVDNEKIHHSYRTKENDLNEKLSHLNTDNNNLKNLTSSKIVFPLFEISELSCRFKDFSTLSNDCKIIIPTLISKYHQKYLTKNKGYNDITRIYTILWGASYGKGWDTGKGGHPGLDIATSKGTPVYAIADGEVIIAKTDLALGKIITIKHNINGNILFSNYGHLSEIFIKKGDKVNVGNKIGEVGSTGNSNGNHLHFQIDKDTPFHPYYYDYNKCPHSYFDIMEKGICFDELKKNTIDPIVFFEKYGTNINLYTDL